MRVACSRKVAPASVSVAPRVVRVSNVAPSDFSSRASRRLTMDLLTPSRAAAGAQPAGVGNRHKGLNILDFHACVPVCATPSRSSWGYCCGFRNAKMQLTSNGNQQEGVAMKSVLVINSSAAREGSVSRSWSSTPWIACFRTRPQAHGRASRPRREPGAASRRRHAQWRARHARPPTLERDARALSDELIAELRAADTDRDRRADVQLRRHHQPARLVRPRAARGRDLLVLRRKARADCSTASASSSSRVAAASTAKARPQPIDFQEPYLRHLLGLHRHHRRDVRARREDRLRAGSARRRRWMVHARSSRHWPRRRSPRRLNRQAA